MRATIIQHTRQFRQTFPALHAANKQEPQKLRVKPHEDMHFLRARGLGIQLSPGALAPPQHHVSGTSSQKNAKENLPSEDDKAQFDELVETWKDSWTSLGHTELHRLNIWSDPDANFQVHTAISDLIYV